MVRRRSDRYGDEVAIRARQQAAVAELGQRALAGTPLDTLIEAAAEQAARELDGDYVSVLELTGDHRGMLIRGGYGFPEGVLGGVLPAAPEDLPGFALQCEGPVLIDDFATETRFGPSPLQRDLDVVSALAAPIGAFGRRFGVIAADSRAPRHFDPDDANFLQSVANVLGAAAEHARNEEMLSDSEARLRELADTTPALMWMTDPEGHVTFVNAAWQRFTGRRLSEELGNTFAAWAHDEDRAQLLEAWRAALARRSEFRFEYRLMHRGGGHRWVLEVASPRFAGGEFAGYAGTAIDIHEHRTMEGRPGTPAADRATGGDGMSAQ
jgi:PAS domain S-box-containing protein